LRSLLRGRTINDTTQVTQLLQQWRSGDAKAEHALTPMIYDTLKRIANRQMSRERKDHTLQATVLVNEAYMQLIKGDISWSDSAHFRAIAAKIMRRTLIDYAREKNAKKRGGDLDRITLMESRVIADNTVDILELDDAITKLAEFDERKAKVIEMIFFGGLSYEEVANVLDISKATVDRELRIAKAWLYNQLHDEE